MGKSYVVYCHTHITSGRKYVGITSHSMMWRWSRHVSNALNTTGQNGTCPVFAAAIRKYGPEAFSHEVLELLEDTEWEQAAEAERKWIALLKTRVPNGFNIEPGGGRLSAETIIRIKASFSPGRRREQGMRLKSFLKPEHFCARMRTQMAALSPEQKKERMAPALVRWRGFTSRERSELIRNAKAKLTFEERQAASRKAHAAQTPEQRRARGLKAAAACSREQQSETARQIWARMTPEKRAARGAKQREAWNKLTQEERSLRGKKSVASQTPEQLRERARKTWETRRAAQRVSLRINLLGSQKNGT